MYTKIYSNDTPSIIQQLSSTPAMKRLKQVGMHCGCEYANFPIYNNSRGAYSRYTHSIGVANIVWNFTKDKKQAAAGLLHDISTPVFAHTIDFMNQDHLAQESTEGQTRSLIEGSPEIVSILQQHDISVEEVMDYHVYPIADNDTPLLSADRLEYTLGNAYLVHGYGLADIEEIYQDILVVTNEYGNAELGFRSAEAAIKFTKISLQNSKLFVSDGDRFSMQYLADLVHRAIQEKVLLMEDLWTTEPAVIQKIVNSKKMKKAWEAYRSISEVYSSAIKPIGKYSVNTGAKKRYISPLVLSNQGPKRIIEINTALKEEVADFLSIDFNSWLYAI